MMTGTVATQVKAIAFDRDIERLTEGFTGREWVFEEIDRWLQQGNERFFILTGEPGIGKSAIAARLTQIRDDVAAYHFCRAGDVETVRPARILRSLAAQLGEHLPDYGQALANTIKPVHLRIEVNINIGSMTGSQVTGVYIENLKESDPENELDILIRAPLEELQKMYAERQQAQPALAVILIDSLDEAVTTTGTNLVKLLTQLSKSTSLPSWVRFIMTSRPERRVLRGFEPLKPYHLRETSDESLADIRRYVEDRVDQPALQNRLQVNQVQPQTLITEITNLSHGNFLYTTLLLNDIEAGRQALDNLAALPKSLDDIYHGFLSRFSEEDWSDRYKPIFGVLTVAQEPISEKQISNFTKIDSEDVRDSIRIARQFFDVEVNEQQKETYSIFHQSLRDYLLDEDRNPDFWCNARKQHQRIIDFYEKTSKSWQELERIDPYGGRYLSQHLVKAERVEELHTLLSLEKEGKNAWFKVKDDEGETGSFLADLELAWSQADEAFHNQPDKSVSLQCRYALMKASINSWAEIPQELIVALVKHGSWNPAKALAYACQLSDPEARIKSLTALASQLHNEEPLKYQALESALQAALVIKSASVRADALSALVDKLPDALLSQGLVAAQAIESVSLRVRVLKALADKMPPTLFPSAWKAAQEIRPASARARVLASLVDKLPDSLVPQTLSATQVIQNESDVADILVLLVDKLPDDLLSQALVAAQLIQDNSYRTRVLTGLADKLPEALPHALSAAQSIQNESARTDALMALADKLTSDLLPQALVAAQAIQNKRYRAKALVALADRLPEAMLLQVLTFVQTIGSESARAHALTALVGKLPHVLPQALSVAQSIRSESARADALMALADKLTPELLPKALYSVNTIELTFLRTDTLATLVNKLPDALLPQALSAVQAIQDNSERARVLAVLADKLPEALPKALEAAQAIQDNSERARVLTALADKLPEALPKALEAAQAIQDKYFRVQALSALANKLTPDLLPVALEAGQVIEDTSACAKILAALADKQTLEDLPSKALKVTSTIRSKSCSTDAERAMMDKMRQRLHPKDWEEAQYIWSRIQSEPDRALALPTLVEKLPPHLFSQALTATQAIWSESYRADVLNALVDKLPPDLLPQALTITQAIDNEFARAHALTALANQLPPELLLKALSAAQSIKDVSIRTDVLTVLSVPLLKVPDRFAVWKDLLHFLSYRTRPDLLSDMTALTPMIIALGGEAAAAETAQAIQDVSRWWH